MLRFWGNSADCQIPLWSLWCLYLELVDSAFRVPYISTATPMPGLVAPMGVSLALCDAFMA
jgi:hypothetical protein